jgi:hypothetical protein
MMQLHPYARLELLATTDMMRQGCRGVHRLVVIYWKWLWGSYHYNKGGIFRVWLVAAEFTQIGTIARCAS